MKCSQVLNKLSAYLDGEISEKEKKLIEDHLNTCKKCSAELASFAELNNTLKIVKDIEIPAYFRTHVKQRIKDQTLIRVPFLEKIRRVVFPISVTAALVISLLFGNFIGRSLFQNVTEVSTQESSEIAGVFGFSSLSEFPEGSLSDVFYDYVPGGNK